MLKQPGALADWDQLPLLGVLGAFLAIIPYIGTTWGHIPVFYALTTTSTFWQPAAVVLGYTPVYNPGRQYHHPKVVGSSVSINPLAAILSLFAGAYLGNFRADPGLPLVAILKVLMDHITPATF